MRELTPEEFDEVGGAYAIPGAIAGAASGAAGYVGTLLGGGTFNAGEALLWTAAGAGLGFISGPMGVVQAFSYGAGSFATGVATGNYPRVSGQ